MKDIVIMTKLFLYLFVMIALQTAQPAFAADAVIGFSHPQYKGESLVFKIPEGHRHLLIRSLPFSNGLRSIIVPPGLKVRYFSKPDFHDWYYLQTNTFSSSVDDISANSIKSMIVFPANQNAPAGLQIVGSAMANLTSFPGVFFPLPESKSIAKMCFTDHTFKKWPMISAEAFGPGMRVVLHSVDNCGVGVSLELGNKNSGLGPNGASFSGDQPPLNGMQKKVQSVYVESIMPLSSIILPKLAEYKTVKGYVLPGTSIVPQLAGTWKSSINQEYTITQNGNKALWRASSFEQSAELTINGTSLQAVYQDFNGNNVTVTGTITKMLESGFAYRIEWDNGVSFMREIATVEPSEMAPTDTIGKIISIGGIWSSGFGQTYTIKQTGNSFTWTVSGSNEQGQGQVKGLAVEASWQGSNGSGANTGKLEMVTNNQAKRITWGNGVVFNLIAAEKKD